MRAVNYTIKLNDTYLSDYDPETGYCDFDTTDLGASYLFPSADEATKALADVVWGGSDKPPAVRRVIILEE